jgi:preprotein translocase subunit SecF
MAKRTRAEKKSGKPQLSTEALDKAQSITNAVVPVSFTKQQRREVQQAIEKGMAKIRSQAGSKNREQDKKIKQLQKQLMAKQDNVVSDTQSDNKSSTMNLLPWILLALTWVGLAVYITMFA